MAQVVSAYDIGRVGEKVIQRTLKVVEEGDQVVLIFVLPEGEDFGSLHGTPFTLVDAQEHINQGVEELQKEGVEAVGIAKRGDPVKIIVDIAEELNCRLVVVPDRFDIMAGRNDPRSLAPKVLKGSKRPVLTVT